MLLRIFTRIQIQVMSIEVSGLIKRYGEQHAVDGISFKVNKGEIVGFLGPNGAGKSTTMKIITGYLTADEGKVLVSGIPVNPDAINARRKIGYLPEANPLYFDMYVREYLRFMAGIHTIEATKRTKRIEQVIELTGLTPESTKKIGQLSKGYKQRVGLAAALLHDPEVLILDEPTTGLDPNQIIEIRALIRNLGTEKTVLFSSHILQEVEAVCNRAIIINKGKIVADDRVQLLQQRTDTDEIIYVRFKENLPLTLLASLKDAKSVEAEGPMFWKIVSGNPDRARRQLFELALQHNLNIVSLHSEIQSLEAVFRDLTSNTN